MSSMKIFKKTKYFRAGMCPFLLGGPHPRNRPEIPSLSHRTPEEGLPRIWHRRTQEGALYGSQHQQVPLVSCQSSTSTEIGEGLGEDSYKFTGSLQEAFESRDSPENQSNDSIYTKLLGEDLVFTVRLAMQYHLPREGLFSESLNIIMNWPSCGRDSPPPPPMCETKGEWG